MPFCLNIAQSMFQLAMGRYSVSSQVTFALVYLDSVVSFSRSVEEHLDHLPTVLGLLSKVSVSLKLKKFFFLEEQMDYLGSRNSS